MPVVGQPGAAQQGPSPLEESLGAIPKSLQEAGTMLFRTEELVRQREELSAQRQKAQDVLDSTVADQAFTRRYQAQIAALQEGDYRTLPEEVVKAGEALLATVGDDRKLTPQAKAFFTVKAQDHINVAQQQALTYQTKRRDGEKTFALSVAVQEAQERVSQATNPYERMTAWGHFEETLASFQATGLASGAALADIRQKTKDAIEVQDVQTAIQADPEAMETQLMAQVKGQPTREDLPLAPREKLAQLAQQATEMRRSRFAAAEHQERYQDYKRKKDQERASIDLRTQIYTTRPSPENVPTFQRIKQQAADAMKAGEIDPSTGEHIMQTADAHAKAAATPRLVDDPPTEVSARLAVHMAETPQQFAEARQLLTDIMSAASPKLKPETYSALSDKLEQREKAGHWREMPEVKAAKEVIMRGALVPFGGTLAGQMKPQMQQKLTWAVDQWESQVQAMMDDPKQGIRAVRKQAMELAWEARRQHLKPDINNKADAQEYLPPEVQAARTTTELAQVIHGLRMLGWSNGSLLIIRDNWHLWQDYLRMEQGRRGGVAPQPGYTGPLLPPSGGNAPTPAPTAPQERRSN